MAIIRITDLKLRAIIGTNDWERDQPQDIIINIRIKYDAHKACVSDQISDTLDYKEITKKVILEVESSRYYLLEKLASQILKLILAYPLVQEARVRVDKPHALRFAESVSVELSSLKDT